MDITSEQLQKLIKLISDGKEHSFYLWTSWKKKCEDVKKIDHYECQYCKINGKYSKGVIVHHVKHLKDRPDLALSIYDPDTNERQLILLCKKCHELQHPNSLKKINYKLKLLNDERWD